MFSNTVTVHIIAIVELSFVLYVVDIVSSVAFSLMRCIKANPFCFERERIHSILLEYEPKHN